MNAQRPTDSARRLASLALAGTLASLAAPAAAQAPAGAPPAEPAARPDPIAAALAPKPGGLTPDQVAKEAAGSSYAVRTKQAELREAAARVDQALVAYFPRVTVTASYTRVSPVESVIGTGAFAFPLPPSVDNQYSIIASLSVPISDYLLRLTQAHATASRAARAKELEAEAQALQAAADGRVAFFNWVRARGQLVVATEAVAQAKAHVDDAKMLRSVEIGSNADVLRLEAQVASAEQVEAEASALLTVAEVQLRTLMHAPEGKPLEIGIDVLRKPPAMPTESFEALERAAYENRRELKALDESQASLREAESATRAGYLPRLDAFANGVYANPNPRIFPQEEKWDFTWDAGLRATWTVNETFTTSGAAAEATARTAAVAEQKGTLRDAVRVEVATAYADVKKSIVTIAAADRGIAASEESLRVQRELFRAGKATAVNLIDSETELTRARLRRIDAHVGLLVAETRLEHATGRDAVRRR